jgi:serine/threonine protein kinase
MTEPMRVTCPGCSTRLKLPAGSVGKTVRCPKCARTLRIMSRVPAPVPGDTDLGVLEADDQTPPPPASGPDREAALAGRVLGGYRLRSVLGRGGKGLVFEAEAVADGRPAAVKVMAPKLLADPEEVERFRREAEVLSRLDHPNLVRMFEVGRQEGVTFLAMELVPGRSAMAELEARGRLPPREATRIVRLAACGLSAAHSQRIVHRDVKPGNILLAGSGAVKVADFGLVKINDGTVPDLTKPGTLVGTPYYMSPEQAQGEPLDGRSDVYSLGVTYYRLLTDRLPFDDDDAVKVVYQQVTDPHPDPRKFVPGLPEPCVRIIDTAMAKSPDDRYQSAEEMVVALQEAGRVLR